MRVLLSCRVPPDWQPDQETVSVQEVKRKVGIKCVADGAAQVWAPLPVGM